jgi:hypothetical protein
MTEFFFTYLRDAIAYQTHCPICFTKLKMDENDATIHKQFLQLRSQSTIVWVIESGELVVNLETNEIEKVSKIKEATPIYGVGYHSSMSYTTAHQSTSGKMFVKLSMDCEDCGQYFFTIQMLVDIGETKIEFIRLNSEHLSVEDESGTLHEIRNVYTTGKTEYNRITKTVRPGSPKRELTVTYEGDIVSLPLIPLDLQHPKKTLERIKTLILFS